MFLKTVLYSQKQGEQGKQGEDVWFLVFFLFLKTQKKILNLENKNNASKT